MIKKLHNLITIFIAIILLSSYSYSQYEQYYDVVPDVPNCEAGALKQSEKDKMLVYLNKIRDLHNLPHFEYDTQFDDEAMEISLICVSNGTLSHTPDESFSCYSQTGYNGGISTNLFLSSGTPSSESSVVAWMNDRNQIELGHRRWIVNPFIKKIAFGRVDGKSTNGSQYAGMAFYYDSKTDQDLSNFDDEIIAVPYGDYPPSVWDFGWSVLSFSILSNKTNRWANNDENIKYSSTINGNLVNEVRVEVEDENGVIKEFGRDAGLGWGYDGYGLPNYCYWQMHGLEQQKVYKVRVYDVLVNGEKRNFSYQFAFRDPFISKPGETILSQPLNNATDINPNVELQWNVTQGADFYVLEVAGSMDFDNDLLYTKTDITTNSHQLSGILEPVKTYYWRVAARNDAGTGEVSDIWNFTTTTAPDPPEISGPADNATNVSITPTFTWSPAPKADSYDLQIADDDSFAGILVNEVGIQATTFKVDSDILGPDSKYYWRIRSVSDVSGPSMWSPTRAFTTAAAAPGKPDILAPASGATDVPANLTFEWASVPGAETYDLEIANAPQFSGGDIIYETSGIEGTKYKMPQDILELETRYWWHVRAVGPGGESDWSRNGRFTVGDASSVNDFVSLNNIEVYPNPASESVTLDIQINNAEYVNLRIYNQLGEMVDEILNAELRAAQYVINYDCSKFSSGVYFYQLTGNNTNVSGRINIVK